MILFHAIMVPVEFIYSALVRMAMCVSGSVFYDGFGSRAVSLVVITRVIDIVLFTLTYLVSFTQKLQCGPRFWSDF